MSLTPTKVLITVMTYPHPSEKHRELVCTAGITEQREWVRLYPIPYRYNSPDKRFHKYQWIELNLDECGADNDKRKESRRPDIDTIRILGNPLSTRNGWADRRLIIDAMPHHTLNELKNFYTIDKTSLGIVRPKRVLDMKIEPVADKWKPKWDRLFSQWFMFDKRQKPLRKIPYKFRYVFECEDSTKPHKIMCEDWELGVLFLKESARLGSDQAAADSVRDKFLNVLCASKRDVRFFVGTVFPYNTWVVLGVFYPPK